MLVTILFNVQSKKSCDNLIPQIEFSINATFQSSVKCSLFEIIFGRKVTIHGYKSSEQSNHEQMIISANSELMKVAENLRNFERNKRRKRMFFVGENVLIKKEPQHIHKDGGRYDGPYKILRFLSPHEPAIL